MVAGLTKLIIEKDKIRGIDAKQTVALVSTTNVPDLDGKQAGVTRLSELAARISLVKSQGDLSVDVVASTGNPNDVAVLELSAGKTRAQYRCAALDVVKAVPKNIADTLVWEIKVDSKLIQVLGQGVSAMGADYVTIASPDGNVVKAECVDATKDVFSTNFEDAPVWIGAGAKASSFVQTYPAKTLLALLKETNKTSNPVSMKLGEGGILSFKVNGFDLFVIPKQG